MNTKDALIATFEHSYLIVMAYIIGFICAIINIISIIYVSLNYTKTVSIESTRMTFNFNFNTIEIILLLLAFGMIYIATAEFLSKYKKFKEYKNTVIE